MTDDDLEVTCPHGCFSIIKAGGYVTSDLSEVKGLGTVASDLCRHGIPRVYPHLFASIRVFYSLLIAILIVVNVTLSARNKDEAITATLQRAHDGYMRCDYEGARRDLLAVLDREPMNDVALDSLLAVEGK